MKEYTIKLPKEEADFIKNLASRINCSEEEVIQMTISQILAVFITNKEKEGRLS